MIYLQNVSVKSQQRIYKCINISKNIVIATKLLNRHTFTQRFIGLLNKKYLNPDEGIILTPCQSIHTICMKFPIDIIFIDKNNIIVKIYKNTLPYTFFCFSLSAKYCLEVHANSNVTSDMVGDLIQISVI